MTMIGIAEGLGKDGHVGSRKLVSILYSNWKNTLIAFRKKDKIEASVKAEHFAAFERAEHKTYLSN